MLRLIIFLGFFIGAGIVAALQDWPYIRELFTATLLFCIISAGLLGFTAWPFFSWALYGESIPETQSYHVPTVVGENGEELRYDARAVDPIIPTPVERYTTRMVTSENESRQRMMGCFLLRSASEYDPPTGIERVLTNIEFPKHQYGTQWSLSEKEAITPISKLEVRRVTQKYSDDGTEIKMRSTEEVYTQNITTCS
jgi:hypothetical protein